MDLLNNPIRQYAWGSHTAIAGVQGRPVPSPQPEAELWMGAHPGAPSRVVRAGQESSLADVVAADPAAELGAAVAAEHGARLPFLLKLLAAEAPLSIQAHPDADQARAGFAAEEAAGVPRDDPKRSYVDPYHKPELLCAVSEFEALCGFREPAETVALLERIDAPRLDEYTAELVARPDASGLRAVVTRLLTLSDAAQGELVEQVLAACHGLSGGSYELAVQLGDRYPGDVGAVIALLLNHVRLQPGEAIFLPAGRPHAYVRGIGVEVMASSDNVLRGGLTPKHVDVGELLRVLRFEPGPVTPWTATSEAPGVRTWRPPVREFALSSIVLDDAVPAVSPAAAGPRVVFCLSGTARADDGTGAVVLNGGQAAYVPAGRPLTISGSGQLFQATTA